MNYKEHEKEIKQRIGFVFDSNIFYEHLTLAEMKDIVKRSYVNWDEQVFNDYVNTFNLPLTKNQDVLKRDDNESIINRCFVPSCGINYYG